MGMEPRGLVGNESGTRAPEVLDPELPDFRSSISSVNNERIENRDDMDAPFLTSVSNW